MDNGLYEQGYRLYQEGLYDEALKVFTACLNKSRQDPLIWHWVGYLQFKTNRFYDALQSFEQGARLLPNDSSFYSAIASSYISLGNEKFADEALQIANELQNNPRAKETILGDLALNRGDYSSALTHFHEALRLSPKSEQADLHAQIGFTHLQLHQYPKARISYEQATNDTLAHPSYYYNLALAQRKTKDYHAAEASLRYAVDINPTYHKAYAKLSMLQFRKGKVFSGMKYLREAWKGAYREAVQRSEVANRRAMDM